MAILKQRLCNKCFHWNDIGGSIISVLALCAVDRRLSQTKDNEIGILCLPTKHTALRSNTSCLGIRKMCPFKVTCLSVDCWFRELVSKKPTQRSVLVKYKLYIIQSNSNLFPSKYSFTISQLEFGIHSHPDIFDLCLPSNPQLAYHSCVFYFELATLFSSGNLTCKFSTKEWNKNTRNVSCALNLISTTRHLMESYTYI